MTNNAYNKLQITLYELRNELTRDEYLTLLEVMSHLRTESLKIKKAEKLAATKENM